MSQFDQHSGTAYKDKLCLFIANAAGLVRDEICQNQGHQVGVAVENGNKTR